MSKGKDLLLADAKRLMRALVEAEAARDGKAVDKAALTKLIDLAVKAYARDYLEGMKSADDFAASELAKLVTAPRGKEPGK